MTRWEVYVLIREHCRGLMNPSTAEHEVIALAARINELAQKLTRAPARSEVEK